MKNLFTVFSIFLLSFPLIGQVGTLVWEDDFNNGELDQTKWSYETGTGVNGDWGTGQLDIATNRWENVSFQDNVPGAENGCLVITTRKESYGNRNYTSGRIRTAGKASWGPGHRISARVFPRDVKQKGQGFAFWMMPDEFPAGSNSIMWPQGGEIDIMEYVGTIPYHNLGSTHYARFWNNNQWHGDNHIHYGAYYSYETQQVPNPHEPGYGGYPPPPNAPNAGSTGFHTYGIDWYKDRMEFFVDDNVYYIHYMNDGGAFQEDGKDQFQIKDIDDRRIGVAEYSNHFPEWHPFEHKMYAILSAGVGGQNYTYGGAIVPEAEFPCSVFIDWVRVYKLNDGASNTDIHSNNFKLYINPSNTALNIQIEDEENYNAKIIDINGNIVAYKSLSEGTEINISTLQKGIYIVLVSNGKLTISEKIIIQ